MPFDDDTPVERPVPGHLDNKPIVFALVNVIAPLQEAVNLLGSLVGEIRRLNHPVEAQTLERLGQAGQAVELVGRSIRIAAGQR